MNAQHDISRSIVLPVRLAMKKAQPVLIGFLVALFFLVFSGAAWAGYATTQLTSNVNDDVNPQINDRGQAVWQEWDGADNEIYLYTPVSGNVQLTSNAYNDESPQINDSGQVVWHGFDGADWEIYLYTPGSGTAPLTSNANRDEFPQINNNGQVAWHEFDGADNEIYLYTPGSGNAPLTSNANDDAKPQINNSGQVVWRGFDGSDYEIYLYTPGSGTAPLSSNANDDQNPQINSSGQVAWQGYGGADWEIYLYTPGSGAAPLTSNANDDINPQINGSGQVAWLGWDGADNEIYRYTPGSGTAQLTSNANIDNYPQINDSGQVVWSGSDSMDYEIYLNTPGSGTGSLTSNSTHDVSPQINGGGQVVWQGWVGSDDEIFLARSGDYYWTWYDNVGGDNWVLMANPSAAPQNLTFNLTIAGVTRDLSAYGNGVVSPGQSITPKYAGVMGGPVKATSTTGDRGIVSQRSLWPAGSNSLEEVLGTEAGKLSSHFWWTWYDQASAGYTNWVLVANPHTGTVYCRIKVAGVEKFAGAIAPGANITPTFPGVMGGPVEVETFTDPGLTVPASVMASQRVLSGGGGAFNEVPGIPDSELSDHYYWTWYDMTAGAKNWVLIANPSSSASIYYEIKVAGTVRAGGNIEPGMNVTPTFPEIIGGPVEVNTWTDSGKGTPAKSIATQRSIFGPSFEEVPGWAAATEGSGFYGSLAAEYHWTWYDQNEGPGVRNWVLIANPSASLAANVTVSFTDRNTGAPRGGSYTLSPGQQVIPTYDGAMGGPVKVSSDIPVISSQRVLWNGYFNEVLGTVLD